MTESQEVTRSEESAPLPNFLFTVALDRPDRRVARTQAKLLAASLLRQFWGGDAVVMRNFPQPLFPVARQGLEEVFIECDLREASESQIATEASRWLFEAAKLIDPSGYGLIVWAHPASLCLRNPDHLFDRSADILVQPELGRAWPKADDEGEQDKPARNGWLGRETISPGLVAVRAGCFREVMAAWEEEFRAPTGEGLSDLRAALQRMLWKTSLRVLPFERGEVALPFLVEKDFQEYREAAWLHFDGAPRPVQRDLALALHLQRTYGDENGLFLDILEA